MINLDALAAKRNEILQKMSAAITNSNAVDFQNAFNELADSIGESVRGEFEQYRNDANSVILAQRGVRQLTASERKFYENLINAMKADFPQQSFTNIEKTFPETVIDSIFENMRTAHPLLSLIDFRPMGLLTKILLSKNGGVATWQALGAEITSELSAEFMEINLENAQLTALVPVKRYMLDMGPAWLDRYVREMLSEAIAVQLEAAIVAGDGKNGPRGMLRKLSGDSGGIYPQKDDLLSATELDAKTFGTILEKLSVDSNSHRRPINRVMMLVNPADYFTKVFPATTVRSTDGTFASNVFPYPTDVVQSPAVPSGKAIFGIPSRYFMGLGTAGRGGTIEYSDQFKFTSLERTYITYFYGNGTALDENDFVIVDISAVEPYVLSVNVIGAESGT